MAICRYVQLKSVPTRITTRFGKCALHVGRRQLLSDLTYRLSLELAIGLTIGLTIGVCPHSAGRESSRKPTVLTRRISLERTSGAQSMEGR